MAISAPADASCASLGATGSPDGLDVPYDPSPPAVVQTMLELAEVAGDDVLYDLGSGDGRIVISAAKATGARGLGIDLDPHRIDEANANANAKAGAVEDKVQFRVSDLYTSDFSEASVVTLFLWPQVNRKLRPILWRQLKSGTRVVSYIWDMGEEWPRKKQCGSPASPFICGPSPRPSRHGRCISACYEPKRTVEQLY